MFRCFGHADIITGELGGVVDREHGGECLGDVDATFGRYWLNPRGAADMSPKKILLLYDRISSGIHRSEMTANAQRQVIGQSGTGEIDPGHRRLQIERAVRRPARVLEDEVESVTPSIG